MFKKIQDSKDLDESQDEMPSQRPDLEIEHGSTRVTVDMTAIEWIILALIVAILGMTAYLLS